MPYKIKGKEVLHLKDGKWKLKQTAHSHAKAVGTVRLLQGIEHGWKPDRQSRNCRVVNNMLKKRIHTDTKSKNQEAYDEHDIVYAPFRPYQDQFTLGRNPTGINIIQEVKRKKPRK